MAMPTGIRGLIVLVALLLIPVSLSAGAPGPDVSGSVYELRTYTTHEGRLPALQARFRDHTMRLFEKHGIQNVGYWIPLDKPNTLIYIVAHKNRDAIASGWKAFGNDPEWQEVARNSQLDGPILIKDGIESQFMTATDFSPIH
jgi:hypothetical protein